MSESLEHAIDRLRQMPEDRQDSIARLVLHEIEEDERWIQITAAHADKLQQLVDDVVESDHRGECDVLDPDKL